MTILTPDRCQVAVISVRVPGSHCPRTVQDRSRTTAQCRIELHLEQGGACGAAGPVSAPRSAAGESSLPPGRPRLKLLDRAQNTSVDAEHPGPTHHAPTREVLRRWAGAGTMRYRDPEVERVGASLPELHLQDVLTGDHEVHGFVKQMIGSDQEATSRVTSAIQVRLRRLIAVPHALEDPDLLFAERRSCPRRRTHR